MKIKKKTMEQILEQVAQKNHITVDEVKRQIYIAMQIGMNNRNTEIQKRWNEVPRIDDKPTPEDLIAYLAKEIVNKEHTV